MGVYVSEINMPEGEGSKLVLQIFPNGEVYDGHGIRLGIANWAKAVPIPPHGRLIDADALGIRDAEKQAYEAFLKEKGKFYVEGSWLEYMQGRFEGLTDASGLVRFAPTIIPAEEE